MTARHASPRALVGTALAAVALGACLPQVARADDGPTAAPPASTAPVQVPAATPPARAARPLRLRTPAPGVRPLMLESRWTVPTPGLPAGSARPAPEQPPLATRRSFGRAFESSLREEAIESRRAALYATIPDQLPELLDDAFISKQRARAAESVLGSAVEAAATETFFGGRFHETSVTIRPMFAVADHGLRIGAAPSWSYGIRAPRGGFRVDIPLVPTAIRLHVHRDLKGSAHAPMRLGGGLLLDPFDEEITAGVSLRF